MTEAISLRVKFEEQTKEHFKSVGVNIRWNEEEALTIKCPEPPLTVEDMAMWIEARVEGLFTQQTRGLFQAMTQVQAIKNLNSAKPETLDWDAAARDAFNDGDTALVECHAEVRPTSRDRSPPRYSEAALKALRKQLRFDLNDRVLCFCGPRWLVGHVVGTAVPQRDTMLPYLVKIDPLPGLPGTTISVPRDKREICRQEVCFGAPADLLLVKAAASQLTGVRPKLRFQLGDAVVCRVENDVDGLERWVSGMVGCLWPQLPGPRQWEMEDIAGEYPDAVPYKVDLSVGGWVFCHRDHHTLIRREGMQPQSRVKGISKRIEVRRAADGGREQVDHQTERCKRMMDVDEASGEDESDSDMSM